MKFKLQSLNDVITNSSMEVYVQATEYTVSAIEQIIDTVLKIGGSDKSCSDLFDIVIDYDGMWWRYFKNYVDEITRDEDFDLQFRAQVEKVLDEHSGKKPNGEYWGDEERYQALINANLIGRGKLKTIKEYTDDYDSDYGYPETSVTIIPKVACSDKDISILNCINDLFSIEASYDS